MPCHRPPCRQPPTTSTSPRDFGAADPKPLSFSLHFHARTPPLSKKELPWDVFVVERAALIYRICWFALKSYSSKYTLLDMSSTPEVSSLPRGEDNQPLPIFSGSASIIDSNPTPSATQTVGVANEDDDTDTHFQKKKRVKKSAVWLEFTEETINGEPKQFDEKGKLLQNVSTRLAVSTYGEDDLMSLIQT
ncbi:hypothetical protein Tsubulata_044021 [Turnera subulata]|uniref:Uncharacterized protein n=1 Tax=Turnera subulata TaxID=218843 RepID=A0A9Q0G673_9ROSI|nr:hypothetical protein Tsubulata_044021 [Turnera subulata]